MQVKTATMGIRNSKVSPFTIPQLLKRMSECDYVEDKNIILEQLEQIDRHLLELKQLAVNMRQLKDANGIYQIVKIGKVLIDGKYDFSYPYQLTIYI